MLIRFVERYPRPQLHGKGTTNYHLPGDGSLLEKCLVDTDRLLFRVNVQKNVAEVCRSYHINETVIKK